MGLSFQRNFGSVLTLAQDDAESEPASSCLPYQTLILLLLLPPILIGGHYRR